MRRLHSGVLFVGCFFLLFAEAALAEYPIITYRYRHHLFSLDPNEYLDWQQEQEVWLLHGNPVQAPAAWRAEGDIDLPIPDGVERSKQLQWNEHVIAQTIDERIGSELNREPGSVTIRKSNTGGILFDGIGMLGRRIDLDRATALTIHALEHGYDDIVLPVIDIQPEMHVLSGDLRAEGITEVVTVGESNYAGSPYNRRHNIAIGLQKFNGTLIPSGSTFSFNETLGPVHAGTGYRQELVIMGDKTIPDYGGGLCQVSTTAYRGVWEYGFPIEQRRNHSFAVQYYAPQGTDATIYPPLTDMKFTNNSSGSLLIQTYFDDDYNAYFIYYGTRDGRNAEVIGPYVWDRRQPPPPREEFTDKLSPGEREKVGSAVPGLKAAWFRVLEPNSPKQFVEGYYSQYEARPLYHLVGIEGVPNAPAWLLPAEDDEGDTTQLTPEDMDTTLRLNPRRLREGQ